MDENTIDTVTVQITSLQRRVLTHLNIKDQLPKIRKILEQNTEIRMNDTLLFAKKIGQSKNNSNELAKITKEDEENMKLEDIIEVKEVESKILHLKLEFNWETLNFKCKLDYGRTILLDKASKSAFTIKNCETTEIHEFQKYTKEIESIEDWIVKTNLLLTLEPNIQDFAKLGVPVENIKKSKAATNHTYSISECSKLSLKINELKPTEEFVRAVKIAIDSKDPRKFRDITKEFGQFIPKEVIFGGRTLFKGLNIQTEYPKEGVKGKINVGEVLRVVGKTSLFKSNNKHEGFKLVGGKQFSSKNFDEQAWIESLEDFRNWDCIKYKDPVSIFQPLSEDLRKQISTSIGKKILYTKTEDYSYKLPQPGILQPFELKNIPEYVLEILRNEDAECNIFATVICTKNAKRDIFNCQILWPSTEDPKLIIHCIQKESKECEYRLKIRLMFIGYDINFNFNRPNFNTQLKIQKYEFNVSNCQTMMDLDLEYYEYHPSALCFGIPVLRKLNSSNNSPIIGHHFFKDEENKRIGLYTFSYCLEKNHYVNLPEFTFYILIISNYSNSDNCRILPFKWHNSSNFPKPNNSLPKYISLYSTGKNNYGPIFLKQRTNEIKIKYITTSCNRDDCICKNNALKKLRRTLKRKLKKKLKKKKKKKPKNRSKKYMEYAFFDPES